MKKFKLFKTLLVAIGLLITGVTTPIWAWATNVYLNGNFTNNNWNTANYQFTWWYNSTDGKYYQDVYATGSAQYFRLYTNNKCSAPSANKEMDCDGNGCTFTTDGKEQNAKYIGKAGIIRICIDQTGGKDWNPWVWIERPTVKFKYGWNGASTWTEQSATSDNQDGSYYYKGRYGSGNYFNAGPQSDLKYAEATVYGSVSFGNYCMFVWDASGYQHATGEKNNTGTFGIYQIHAVSYNGNGNTGGDVPSNTDALHNRATTLATNSGSLVKSQYVFTGWNTLANGKGTHYDAGAKITTTTAVELFAEWQPVWAIKGSGTELGGWSAYKGLEYNSTTGKYEAEIYLAANSTYEFKVCDRGNSDNLYGYGATEDKKDYFSFIGQTTTCNVYRTDGGKDKNVRIFTAGAGNYKFEYQWSTDHGIIEVKYPTVTHPSSDYIYYYDYDNHNSHGGLVVHLWNTAGTIYTGDDNMPSPSYFTFDGKRYYYAALGATNEARFAGKTDVSLYKTENLSSASSKKGKYYNVNSNTTEATRWNAFTQTVTLDNQSATTAGASSVTATYGSAMPSIASNKPAKDHYTFGGYFASAGGGGTKYYNADGTSAHAWDQTGASPRIYAKWTEITRTVSFANDGHGTTDPNSDQTVGEVVGIAINASNSTGYHFSTWTISSGTGSFASAATTASNTFYPTSAATIRADFAPNPYTITLNGNGGSGHTTSVTATFDSNMLSTGITNPTQDGYVFQGWYSGEGGTGEMIINPSGELQANVTDYTGASGIWKKASDTNLYAKWLALSSAESTCWVSDGNGGYTWNCDYITELAMPAPSSTSWDGASWGGTPTSETKVVIPASTNITVDVAHAQAKEVVLGSGAKLTIGDNKGLEVEGAITMADGSAPTASDLKLVSSKANGNATLIFDNSNGASATVEMYSIAEKDGSTWNWQYVGCPFESGTFLDYYSGSYIYKWSGSGWAAVGAYDDVEPFAGYCLSQDEEGKLTMSGPLVTATTKSVSLSVGDSKVLANSWTAPIYIGGFTASTFTSAPATIYLFNTGNAASSSSSGSKGAAGTYVAVPLFSAPYAGDCLIAPMQGFFVTATGSSKKAGTITMNYDDLVRTTTTDHSVNAGAMYAPKRVKAENDPEVIKIWAESSKYSDKLVILAREDFSTGFDNGWDGTKKGYNSESPAIFVINENSENDAVSAIPDFEGAVVGFKAATEETEYTVRFEYDGEETLYLNDQKAEESALISTGETYNFNANSEDNEARFVISRTPIKKITTGVENVADGSHARKQMINGQLYIVRDGQIYDMLGKTIQ